MAKKNEKKAPKAKQMKIPGTERKSIPEIEKAADKYRSVRDERMALTKKEAIEQTNLVNIMKKHDVSHYIFEDDDGEEAEVKIVDSVKAKVKKVRAGDGDDE